MRMGSDLERFSACIGMGCAVSLVAFLVFFSVSYSPKTSPDRWKIVWQALLCATVGIMVSYFLSWIHPYTTPPKKDRVDLLMKPRVYKFSL